MGRAIIDVTVAVPVRDGGPRLERVLRAVCDQDTARRVELLVCDSGSTDGSDRVARDHGARVLSIEPAAFSHGPTRNLLMREARGEHVVFLTQDAVPAGAGWLDALVDAFASAPDVALAFGPYLPQPGATPMTARELEAFFGSFGAGRTDRLDAAQRDLGPRGFFTDANGAVARAAWERVPFRDVPYAEDQQLAIDMLGAGYAKVYVPGAAVEHSHEYSVLRRVQRCFDEWRALREVYGFVEPLTATTLRDRVLSPARADVRWARGRGRMLLGRLHALRPLSRSIGAKVARDSSDRALRSGAGRRSWREPSAAPAVRAPW